MRIQAHVLVFGLMCGISSTIAIVWSRTVEQTEEEKMATLVRLWYNCSQPIISYVWHLLNIIEFFQKQKYSIQINANERNRDAMQKHFDAMRGRQKDSTIEKKMAGMNAVCLHLYASPVSI